MFSSSRWITSVFGLTLAASLAIAEKQLAAQTAAQDTSHKKSTMPMGNKTQKKAASKSAKAKKPAGGKKTAKEATKSVAPGGAAKKPARTRIAQPMTMPMGAEPHHAPAKAGQMRMDDTAGATHADSAHEM